MVIVETNRVLTVGIGATETEPSIPFFGSHGRQRGGCRRWSLPPARLGDVLLNKTAGDPVKHLPNPMVGSG